MNSSDKNPQIDAPPTPDRKKTIRRAVDHLYKYTTDDQLKAVAAILNLKTEDSEVEEHRPCNHDSVICKCCGREGKPAQLMASRPRKRGPEAAEQSRQAVKKGMERKAGKIEQM